MSNIFLGFSLLILDGEVGYTVVQRETSLICIHMHV